MTNMTLRPSRPATIYDVARVAGVSHQTVSRVINDRAGVSAQTRAAVREASERLGFVRNESARRLRTPFGAQTGLIVVEDVVDTAAWGELRDLTLATRAAGGGALLTEFVVRGEIGSATARLLDAGARAVTVCRPQA